MHAALSDVVSAIEDMNDPEHPVYVAGCYAIRARLTKGQRAVLEQCLCNGPIWDGDIMSKTDRNWLLQYGILSRVVVKGEQGFVALTYFGWDVAHAVLE